MNTMKILVVDDQPSARQYMASLLKGFTEHIDQAANGHEALLLTAKGSRYDLIVTDFDMPLMDGMHLCQQLKSRKQTRSIPVIMASTFDCQRSVEMGFESGAAAFIPKREITEKLRGKAAELLSCAKGYQGSTILVVDDSPVILRILKSHLSREGMVVFTASNGQEAMQFLQNRPTDLVLTDISMPRMNGIDLCQSIKRTPNLSGIPVVIMSNSEKVEVMRESISKGAASYIRKPFNLNELSIQIEKILSDQYQLLLKDRERLHAERDLLLSSIMALANALEARDPYTRGHSESVAGIVEGMAEILGTPPEEKETIRMGTLLHDIGKIGISDEILRKKGPLTKEEFASIKKHPLVGADILKAIANPGQVIPIVFHHHERFDGKGYPTGLAGNDIPFWARLTAVADTFDAMISDRPYRKGMPAAKALAIIQEVRGSQLCPECVDIFLEWHAKCSNLDQKFCKFSSPAQPATI